MGTATAGPALGRAHRERLRAARRLLRRSCGPAVTGEPGSAERLALKRLLLVIPLANLAGAVDLFAFLWYVLPLPAEAAQDHVRLLNTVAFLACLFVTFAICGARSHRAAEPIARWVESGEPADPQMVKLVLRQPLQQTIISAQAWALSALAFGILNAFFSPALGALVGVAILLGAVTTCGLLYLLAEKSLAPITAAALSSAAPRKPALPGVDARVLVTFAVTTAGPLLAMAALAIAVLSDITVSSGRLALTMLVLALVALFSGLLAMKLVARSLAALAAVDARRGGAGRARATWARTSGSTTAASWACCRPASTAWWPGCASASSCATCSAATWASTLPARRSSAAPSWAASSGTRPCCSWT